MSIISSNMFTFIHQRLYAIADRDGPFGGYNVILFGDFHQLRPVRGHFLFKHEVLWPLFTPQLLSVNKRQAGHDNFIALLNNLCIGLLKPNNVTLLHSSLWSHHPHVNTSHDSHISQGRRSQ